MAVKRGEVYLIQLDPVVGNEVAKPRPCLVVSPDDLNHRSTTFIAAPLSSRLHNYPSRLNIEFNGRSGQVQLDQIRALSPLRIIAKVGELNSSELSLVLDRLQEMFAV